jgi:NAD-dependent dihydropyrimidine dehydrogenase PreA subunit
MRIDPESCAGCGRCIPYCPVQAIERIHDGTSSIREDDCVECGVCTRHFVCPNNCFQTSADTWPRCIRAWFSNPLVVHQSTRVPGRGTEEMKTNDVTGRLRAGQVGLAIEPGRPGTGVRFRDVQVFTSALASLGVHLEPANPLSSLLADPTSGTLLPEILDEKVLSVVIECIVREGDASRILEKLEELEHSMPTVFTVSLARRTVSTRDSILLTARRLNWSVRQEGKVNVGLGYPPAEVPSR